METTTLGNWVPVVPEVGKEYEVRHSRKGTFQMRVTEVNGPWAKGLITSGVARAIMRDNVREEGEHVTVRDTLSYWIPVPEAADLRAALDKICPPGCDHCAGIIAKH